MPKDERFSFVCNAAEREAIRQLAVRLKRNESDAVRWVVCEAARELAPEGKPQVEGEATHANA